MISILNLAFGGMAPPVLALHLAFAGMAPADEVVVAPAQAAASSGGGVVSSATIPMSEWLRLAKKRPVEALAARSVPTPQAIDAEPLGASPATRTKRRLREEELFILMRLP